jgi:hypothetical protein
LSSPRRQFVIPENAQRLSGIHSSLFCLRDTRNLAGACSGEQIVATTAGRAYDKQRFIGFGRISRCLCERKDMSSREQATRKPASRLIDQRIRDLRGWRGETLARMRALILEADPEMTEEWKWRGTPVWSHHGIVCTGETYTKVVKLTFARGASIPDPSRLFNSSLEGNTRRALDIHEGEKVDAGAFKALVKAAVVRNALPAKKKRL